jgi:hypothetical protein
MRIDGGRNWARIVPTGINRDVFVGFTITVLVNKTLAHPKALQATLRITHILLHPVV